MKLKWENEGVEAFSFPYIVEITDQLLSTPLSLNHENLDKLAWGGTDNGSFTVSSVYNLIEEDQGTSSNPSLWNAIWKVPTLPKIQFFLWQMAHRAILTREILCSRGINTSPLCPLCSNETESIEHMLFECHVSKQGWLKLDPTSTLFHYNVQNWHDLIEKNCSSKKWFSTPKLPCNIIFSFMVWHIWLFRNAIVFENSQIGMLDTRKVLEKASEFYALAAPVVRELSYMQVGVSWEPPPSGWYKINTDGAAKGNPGRGGAGVVIRNHSGTWVVGSYRHIPCVQSLQAELWALRDGLLLAKNLNLERIIVEMDALNVVNMLKDNNQQNEILTTLLLDCRTLLEGFGDKEVKHIFREGNRSADALAKMGCDFVRPVISDVALNSSVDLFNFDLPNVLGFTICINPPASLRPLLAAETGGDVVHRLVV